MDLKEMIRWLFQARNNSGTVRSARLFEKCSKLCISIVFVAVFAACFTDCSGDVSNFTEIRDSAEDVRPPSVDDFGDGRSIFDVDVDKSDEFRVARGLFGVIRSGARYLDQTLEENVGKEAARTFGRPMKKLQAMMIPLMFKLGIMSTLIVLTFMLSVKAVLIGKILIILKMGAVLAKFFALKEQSQHNYHQGWGQQKQVHLHVHNAPSAHDSLSPLSSYAVPTAPYAGPSAWARRDPAPVHEPHVERPIGHQGSINTPYGHYVRTGGPTAPGL